MLRTTRITPPAGVDDPVTVYLLDHGRTPSLVLPNENHGMVRYVFGDWTWYARDETGAWNAVRALGWPTRGTLGRRELAGPRTTAAIHEQVVVTLENVYPIVVEREAVRQLRQELDRAFWDHADRQLTNERYALDFVRHRQRYSYFHNSNHVTAQWLQQLHCRVDGPAFASRWRVQMPED